MCDEAAAELHTTKRRDKNAEVRDNLCMETQLFSWNVVWSTDEPPKACSHSIKKK